jgi:hypothetical protein
MHFYHVLEGVKNRLCIIIIIAFLNIMMVDGDKEGNNYVRSSEKQTVYNYYYCIFEHYDG